MIQIGQYTILCSQSKFQGGNNDGHIEIIFMQELG